MSEKRRPSVKIVAEIHGKPRVRVELFQASLWPDKFHRNDWGKYRVRIDGRWVHGDKAWTISQVFAELRGLCVRGAKRRVPPPRR